MQYSLNYSGTRFLPLKIKITQFHDGFRLKHCCLFILPDCSPPFPLLPSVPSHPPFYQVPLPLDPPPPHLLVARGLQFSPFLIPSHPTSPHSSTRSHITFVCTLRAAYTAEFWKKYLFFLFPESILSVKSARLINFLHYIGVFAGMNGRCLSICL